jgi:predicted  nucleic acid-binding Zn-ribbon protein
MRSMSFPAAIAVMAVLLSACANQKEPAESAVAKVEASLSELKADAAKYAAEDLEDVEQAVGRLKARLAEQDYGAALKGAPAVASTVAALEAKVAQRKADAEELLATAQQEWTALAASMPQLVDDLQKRVDSLSRTRRYPQGMDKAAFDAAKAEFEKMKASWNDATTKFNEGLAADAVRSARSAKAKGEHLVRKFGA